MRVNGTKVRWWTPIGCMAVGCYLTFMVRTSDPVMRVERYPWKGRKREVSGINRLQKACTRHGPRYLPCGPCSARHILLSVKEKRRGIYALELFFRCPSSWRRLSILFDRTYRTSSSVSDRIQRGLTVPVPYPACLRPPSFSSYFPSILPLPRPFCSL